MAWALEPQLGFHELAGLFQRLGGNQGRVGPVDFCRAFQAVDMGVPLRGERVDGRVAFSPRRQGDSISCLAPQKEDERFHTRCGHRPLFNVRKHGQDAKQRMKQLREREFRSRALDEDAAAALQDFVRRHKVQQTSGKQQQLSSSGGRPDKSGPAESLRATAARSSPEVPKPAATTRSYSSEDFDEDQSDAAYSDSFQNDYGSRSSGSSSPRDKKERS
ncbi:unnamed protein product, partial [Symbiodinium pilosum]